ncbi:hypothetical protein GCM10027275_09990 [Rhabdobacter roseus]
MRVMLLTSGAVLFLTCTSYFVYEIVTFRQVTEAQLVIVGKMIATNSTAALAFDDSGEGEEILHALQADPQIVAAGLYDGRGKLFSRYPDSLSYLNFPAAPRGDGYAFSRSHLEGFQPVVQGDKRLGTLYLKMELSAVYQRLQLYGLIAFGVIGFSFLLAYTLSRELQKVISEPILSLAQTARVVSQRFDYSVRAKKIGNDELGLLTDAFNTMLGQIEAQNQEIRTFNQSLEQKVRERTHELELANQELKRKNEFVRTIIHSSVQIIAVLDQQMRYTAINKSFEQLYRVDRQQVVGRSLTEVFPQTKDTQVERDIREALRGNPVHHAVARSAVIPGYFETHFIPLKEKEDVYGVLLVSHDITRIIEVNDQLKKANQELIRSNQDLGQFAYVASHDLQEPLRKIQVFAELLRHKRHDETETQRYLEKVHAASGRMTTLIQDVLSYSRLARTEESLVETNLNAILDQVKSDFDLLIQQKGATIICSNLPVVKGIPAQLGQLFANLISNALKFNRQNPLIRITVRELPESSRALYESLSQAQAYWEIQVIDNGIGFESQYSQQIFTIFQRLNNQQTYSGTGIGLALCRKIVENHQGVIVASSEPGKGATFTVVLPQCIAGIAAPSSE